MNGITPLIKSCIGTRATPLATFKTVPAGGVIRPIALLMTNRTPKYTGSRHLYRFSRAESAESVPNSDWLIDKEGRANVNFALNGDASMVFVNDLSNDIDPVYLILPESC